MPWPALVNWLELFIEYSSYKTMSLTIISVTGSQQNEGIDLDCPSTISTVSLLIFKPFPLADILKSVTNRNNCLTLSLI